MPELTRIADQFTVLRDGKRVATGAMAKVADTRVVELMTGRKIELRIPMSPIARRIRSCRSLT